MISDNFPKITVTIVTLNNERSIGKCIKGILAQDYPKDKIEYLNVDGGSTDTTIAILKKNKFTVIESPIKRNAEAQRGFAVKAAKNNIIISVDADNYMPTKSWIREMVLPFMEDNAVVHANTLRYTYQKKDVVFNRYTALFGTPDPIVYYVGRPDRISQRINKWTLGTIIKETNNYFIVEFSKETLPTVGCNGVAFRRDLLLKYANSRPEEYLHIDVFADLIDKGFNRFAIVKNDIIHDTAVSLSKLMQKRTSFLNDYYLRHNIQRRYLIYNPKKITDNIKMFLFIFYTITIVKTLYDGLKGYIQVKDVAWFMHPLVCWVYLYSYSFATVRKLFVRK